jgi:hypothetical protein
MAQTTRPAVVWAVSRRFHPLSPSLPSSSLPAADGGGLTDDVVLIAF